ncbi:MAG: aminotransferase class V-fold PLP-dependent enzyme [Nitrospiraceae bacterium]|nr:aminotransferase class V-fold PLP-dependent enzyme [Nitrospiraceae bacterium]
MNRRAKLMIPGPVEVRPEILEVMARPIVPHYENKWAQIHADTIKMAKALFQTTGDLFIMVGSGSAGLEAGLSQLAGNEGKTLIPTNGVFGKLLVKIARTYSDQVEEVEFPDKEPIAPEALDRLLTERKDIRSVAVVHSETHTGILNPVHDYGDICRAHGALLMVDAVSSIGGAPLKMDSWKIDLCVTASQKALGAPPGLCLVAVNPRCWPLFEKRASGPGSYLNLNAWRERATVWADWHPTLTTMAVNNFLALRKALELALAEGLDNRFARHRRISLLVRQGGYETSGLSPMCLTRLHLRH